MVENEYLVVRNKMITKANELIQKSRFSLSLQQQKIVLYLISQISPFDEDFKLYNFSISEFCRVCGITEKSGQNYKELKSAVKEIADKSVWVRLENGKDTLLRWIEKPYIDEGSGNIQIRLDMDMKPFLLQLKSNFTSYELIWTLHFKSKYTIRLYELVKSIHFHDLTEYTKRYTVDELKTLLGGESYKEYRDFKRRALQASIEEINQFSDKNISMREIRKGRKVLGIELTVSSKDSLEAGRIRSEIEKDLGIPEGQITFWDRYQRLENISKSDVIERFVDNTARQKEQESVSQPDQQAI